MKRAGVGIKNYEAEIYHKSARKNMGRKVSKAPSSETILIIERQILNEQWSPEQISNWLRINNHETVSHTWIYQYIRKDKSEGGELSNNLRIGSYSKGHKPYKGNIVDRVSIEKRATIVNERKRLGDYEIDLIVGPKNKGAILTIIDRMSRYCTLEKLTGKTSLEVSDKIIKLLDSSSNRTFTVTTDNGTEFTDHKKISEALNIKFYFAHPYASYERGSIENLNGLVRQYIPKGTDFANVSQDEVKIIEGKLNRRPRKVLEFLSPIEYTKSVKKSHLKL
jgi:IS30 family transposase